MQVLRAPSARTKRDRLEKAGKIQTQAPPVRKKRWVDPKTGEVRTAIEGIDPSWSYPVGRAPWDGIARGCEGLANALHEEVGREAATGWITWWLDSYAFKKYADRPGNEKGGAGMPGGILPQQAVRNGTSPILMLDRKPMNKQLKSRRKRDAGNGESFEWTEYRKLPSLLEKANIITSFERSDKPGVWRTIASATDDEKKGYAIIWDTEDGRNLLVTLFRPGERQGNTQDFPAWVEEQKRLAKNQGDRTKG